MARKVLVRLVDDLDGSPSADVAPVTFALDGVTYQIDLNKANAGRLREGLAAFVASARRTSGRVKRGTAVKAGSATTSGDVSAIRDWAKQEGYPVSARGRIPANILEAYNTARSGAAAPAAPRATARTARTARAKTAAAAKSAPTATAPAKRGRPAGSTNKAAAARTAAAPKAAAKRTPAKAAPAKAAAAAKSTAGKAATAKSAAAKPAAKAAKPATTPRPRRAVKAKG